MALKRNVKKLGPEPLWEYALRCLDLKPYSVAELKSKLVLKSESPETVRSVMEKLREYGLLDDSRFAESFASSRLEGRSFGAMRVLQDLRARRVSSQTAEKAVRQVYGEISETELIARFLDRKFRTKDLGQFLKEPKNLASVYRKLRVAGFSSASSIGVLKRYAADAGHLDALEAAEDAHTGGESQE